MMALGEFVSSGSLTLGVELELQLVSLDNHDLIGRAPELLHDISTRNRQLDVKPEMTKSMIEMATGICSGHAEVIKQLGEIRDLLVASCDLLGIGICGGGTHPFQNWGDRKIFDKPRFNHLSELYGYLAKQFTVFGQHVHIGCPGPDVALYMIHGLSRFIPHFIALSASSPYVQGIDTGFHSARLNSVFAFPLSGRMPFVENWSQFEAYFSKMADTGVVSNMKDFYWDIRPKPEYGTIEVRVMDTPLCLERAAQIAAYIQSIARYLIVERPFHPCEDDYLAYTFNRFQACRFGYSGTFVDPQTHQHRTIGEDIESTFARIEQHAIELGADAACHALRRDAAQGVNDSSGLRNMLQRTGSLPDVVQHQCALWRN